MAKSGFWLRGAKGKLAGTTLYQSGGRTLQREIVTPKNPQTDAQMQQRLNMAVVSKFFQDAQQNRFAVAFANKKSNQSNFNAFSSSNLKQFGTLIYPTKDQINDPAFCAYFPWICSQGNLQGLDVTLSDELMSVVGADIDFTVRDDWGSVIAQNPTLNLQYGDIITVTAVLNDMRFSEGNIVIGDRTPVWATRQFIIGADLGDGTITDYLEINGFELATSPEGQVFPAINLDVVYGSEEDPLYFGPDEDGTNKTAMMCCVTRSRFENGKTQVSNSRFWLDDEAWKIMTRLSYDTQLQEAIESYRGGARYSAPTEVLQGNVAINLPRIVEMNYTTKSGNAGVRHSFPAALGDLLASNTFEGSAAGGAEASMNRWSLKGIGEAAGTFTVESTGSKVKLIAQPPLTKMADGSFETPTMGVWALDADLTTAIDYTVKFNGETIFTAKLAKKA